MEADDTQIPVVEPSDRNLTEDATLGKESVRNQAILSDLISIGAVNCAVAPGNTDATPGVGEPSEESKDLVGGKRLSEPLFLRKMLLEECGDTWELTIVVMTLHAVMLESGFVLFHPDLDMRYSFSDDILSTSLKYTLPALVAANEPSGTIESVSLKFQRLGHMVAVYGFLGSGSSVRKVYLDKQKYVPVVDLLMGTLESNKEDTSSIHSKVFMCWRMIKDVVVTPLLIDLCCKTGLGLPPCFMYLPSELKSKILESLPGVDIARLACVSSELRNLASDNALWNRKWLEESEKFPFETKDSDVVAWKDMYAISWRKNMRYRLRLGRNRFVRVVRKPVIRRNRN